MHVEMHAELQVRCPLEQCFSTFVRPRPGKYLFVRQGPVPNKFTRKYLSSFFKFIH